MKYPVYAIKDLKADFLSPMIDVNDDTAKRNFAQTVNSNTGIIGFAPADFALYRLGEFDSRLGKIVPLEVIDLVCFGSDLVGGNDER